MSEAPAIATWDVLQELGFTPDAEVISDVRPGLSFNFGNFKLSASCVMSLRFTEVVLFLGSIFSRRSVAFVQFEMPRSIHSKELCAAWMVWNLDSSADRGVFTPTLNVPWLEEGRINKQSLPWEIDRVRREKELEIYQARPSCAVARDWWRLASKKLASAVSTAPDELPVEIGFDGSILTIICEGNVVALSAEGKPWPKRYAIPAGKLRTWPKRLMQERVVISVWDGHLEIGPRRYSGLFDVPDTVDCPSAGSPKEAGG